MPFAAITRWRRRRRPAVALAAPVDALFQQFGLFGTWASDCAHGASPANPHVSIATPSLGQVIEDHDLGHDYAVNRYSMLSAERLSDDRPCRWR